MRIAQATPWLAAGPEAIRGRTDLLVSSSFIMRRFAALLVVTLVCLALHLTIAGDQVSNSVDTAEGGALIRIAAAELARRNVPVGERRVSVTADDDRAAVTFHLPDGMRGGDFIVRVDGKTW
jgi:hypothetical protein